jgi:hypothetical protein
LEETLFTEARLAATQAGLKVDSQTEEAMRLTSAKCSRRLSLTALTMQEANGRFLSYFSAKAALRPHVENTGSLSASDLADFSCDYLEADFNFAHAKIRASGPVRLVNLTSSGNAIDYTPLDVNARLAIHPDSTILVPLTASKGGTIAAQTSSGKLAYWTGSFDKSATSGSPINVDLAVASTTAGSEIYINSRPEKATVYFGDKKWYRATNTSCVRDPGRLKVKISLEGYEDWVAERTLQAGDSWTINVDLKKKP